MQLIKNIILLFCLISIADSVAIDIIPIKSGDKAPKDGFFVDRSNMDALMKINEDKKLLEQQNIRLKDLAIIKDDRIKLYQDETNLAYRDLQKERTKGDLKGVGGFFLGVLATGLASYVAIKTTK